ncbi:AraC family transcriptional regulator [Gracilimonas mengyeensis]|uniref:Helix-turn-helix domain-containing protein n=1 Tax=Gracilimonas mengyeensis TaxID=1302730 RepID=A0A521DIE1_9BACT|nr:AraC family transcriptional regulator ligand-binding domain-containing protein [Gracilimonas mengyeensis]SMO71479.1 Helix-turn-helix domain-containing protein [Gracilimonas mengyeensis]
MSFVIKSIFNKVVEQAEREGLAADTVEHLGIPSILQNDSRYVPTKALFDLYEIIDQHLEPGFSIRVGQLMVLDDYDVLGLAWKTCLSPRDMFKRCERFFGLMTDTQIYKVEDEGETGSIYMFREATRRGIEISNEGSLVATLTVIQKITGVKIQPIKVTYSHSAPDDITPYEDFFSCEVQFSQEFNRIIFRSEDLDTKSLKADKSINQFMMERLQEKAEGAEVNADKLLNDSSILIQDALPSGIPFAAEIGKHLGMSTRTLSRRLSEKGYTYRQLVQDTQQQVSTDLLSNTSETVSEIAFQVGFSEQSAFNRAFKRWTGQSPLEYRKGSQSSSFGLKG